MTKKIQIEFTCDNAEFDGMSEDEAIEAVLQSLFLGYEISGAFPRSLFDVNGNKIGHVSVDWDYGDESDD